MVAEPVDDAAEEHHEAHAAICAAPVCLDSRPAATPRRLAKGASRMYRRMVAPEWRAKRPIRAESTPKRARLWPPPRGGCGPRT